MARGQKIKMLALELPGIQWELDAQKAQPDNSPTHRHMLGNNIPITYPLTNIASLTSERVFYSGFPLSIERLDGCWVRALAYEEI